MSLSLALALFADPAVAIEHRAQVDHRSGPVEATYRAQVKIRHKQVGTATKPGTPSTLRCVWRADVLVTREARHGSGSVLARTHNVERAMEGSRTGACATHRDAIADEVARRSDELRAHAIAVAQEDHGVLQAELDRLFSANQG